MATLQVKNMDDALYKALSAYASRENRSISQQVVRMIQDHLSQPAASAEYATDEFLKLTGSWGDDRPAKEIIAEIRNSRRSGRRDKVLDNVFD